MRSLQLVAKALVSGLVSLVIAIAASSPGGTAALEAQAAVYTRGVCTLLASAASEEWSTGQPVTIPVYSPFAMNVSISGASMKCSAGGSNFEAPLSGWSLPFSTSFVGDRNFTVWVADGILQWW